jgi:hypothetical protein
MPRTSTAETACPAYIGPWIASPSPSVDHFARAPRALIMTGTLYACLRRKGKEFRAHGAFALTHHVE